VDSQCLTVFAGFDDGVVRVLTVQKMEDVDQYGRRLADKFELVLKHVLKPHNAHISAVAIDSRGELLATGVSYFRKNLGSMKPYQIKQKCCEIAKLESLKFVSKC